MRYRSLIATLTTMNESGTRETGSLTYTMVISIKLALAGAWHHPRRPCARLVAGFTGAAEDLDFYRLFFFFVSRTSKLDSRMCQRRWCRTHVRV